MDFLQSNAKSENGFLLIEIRPDGGFLLRIPNPDFMDFLFTVRLRNPKTTILIWNCFSNPFSDFQKKKRKEREFKNTYLSVEICVSDFAFDSKSRFQFPIKRTLSLSKL